MTVSYRTGITILQFIFFVPSLFLGLYLCFRPGKKAITTWRFITSLSALRVAGGVSYFISLSHPSVNVYVAVVVCELVGLAPLTLTLMAFVIRVLVYSEAYITVALIRGVLTRRRTNRNQNTCTFPRKTFFIITAISLTGLITGIVGTNAALKDASSADDVAINGLMKAALALFLASFGLILFFFAGVVLDIKRHPAKRRALGTETRILIFIALAAPFVFVRLLYAALGDYTGSDLYSPIDGNNTVYLCMVVLMEIIAVAICFASAFFVPMPENQPAKTANASQDSSSYTPLPPRTQRTSHDLEIVPPRTRDS